MPITRLLLDNNVSRHLVRLLRPHEAIHAATLGWAALSNGDLIRAAQAEGFSVIINLRPEYPAPTEPQGQALSLRHSDNDALANDPRQHCRPACRG
jgi:hypothetical protein